MKKILIVCILILGATSFAQNIETGKSKSMTCVACHGNNGISSNPMYPTLAGKKADFLIERMKAYKKGTVKTPNATMMKPMMEGLNEDDMKHLAAYFASINPAEAAPKKRRRD